MFVNKVVLPVAGKGTRLLPITKEQPKEMLPIFSQDTSGGKRVVPIIQIIFEQLFSLKFRNFCFIVGKNKRIIEDHFTFNDTFDSKSTNPQIKDLSKLDDKISQSSLIWINQSKPLGFGHAVLQAKTYVNDERFLLHAGDTLILSKKNSHMKKLFECHQKNKSMATFIVEEIDDPRMYGVVDGIQKGNSIKVTDLEEKPNKPKTNLAIVPLYIFEPIIFDYLEKTKPQKNNEIQLTDAIIKMVKDNLPVYAINLSNEITQLDIGNPESYRNSLEITYNTDISF